MFVKEISEELEKHADPEWKKKIIQWQEQHQEESKVHGVSTPAVRKLSTIFFSKVKNKTKEEILHLCGELLASGYVEERTIAFDWAFRLRKRYERSDFDVFELWLKKYVQDWGSCDDLCTHALGAFIFQFPQCISNVKKWARSTNRWMRRACAVVVIYSVRRRKQVEEICEIADMLLTDSDIMVQKGYGWMLKEASNKYPKEVFNYVLKHRKEMPRTSLRYAIEKLPSELRKEAMKRQAQHVNTHD
jgi:3-methyladenine DNA glycosylase AlkD